jgi:DNA-binding LacI/PurR family transcriptional regulator
LEPYLGIPIVFVDRASADIVADAVVLDNAGGMAAAVEHPFSFGHERIGILSHARRLSSGRERVEAFESVMAAAGLEAGPCTRTDCGDAVRREAPPRSDHGQVEDDAVVSCRRGCVSSDVSCSR